MQPQEKETKFLQTGDGKNKKTKRGYSPSKLQ